MVFGVRVPIRAVEDQTRRKKRVFGQFWPNPPPSPLFNGDLLINVTSDQKSQMAVFPRIILGRVSYPWMVSKTIFDYPPPPPPQIVHETGDFDPITGRWGGGGQ